MKKKTQIVIGISLLTGVGLYFLLRRPSYRFVDNVFCEDDECSNVNIAEYIPDAEAGQTRDGTNVPASWLNLLMNKEHNFSVGDEVFIEQDDNAVYPEYDGNHMIQKIITPFIVEINTPRLGSSEYVGGTISKKSMLKGLIG